MIDVMGSVLDVGEEVAVVVSAGLLIRSASEGQGEEACVMVVGSRSHAVV